MRNRHWLARLRLMGRQIARLAAWQPRSPTPIGPPLERRRPRLAHENYVARHLIEHTLDHKAGLRRLAPHSREAAERYHELLTYELNGLEELIRVLRRCLTGPELADFLVESAQEMERLRIEVAWALQLLRDSAAAPEPSRTIPPLTDPDRAAPSPNV